MMEKMNSVDIANQLISCAVPGGIFNNLNKSFKSFDLLNGISILHEQGGDYTSAIKEFFATDKNIELTYTFDTFEKMVAAFIAPHVIKKTTLKATDVRCFFEQLKAKPVLTYNVFRPILGIEIKQAESPIKLGPYTLYDTRIHADQLNSDMEDKRELLIAGDDFPYLIRVATSARDENKGVELADILFEKFESTIRYIIGNSAKKFDIGVVNFRGSTRKSAFVIVEDGTALASHGRDRMTELIPLDDQSTQLKPCRPNFRASNIK